MDFGEKLKYYRNRAGLSQAALGELVGLQQQRVAGYEKGTRTPKYETRMMFAVALGLANNLLYSVDLYDYVPINTWRLRQLFSLTADDLGRRLSPSLSGSEIEDIEAGRTTPTAKQLADIIRCFEEEGRNKDELDGDVQKYISELKESEEALDLEEQSHEAIDVAKQLISYYDMLNDDGQREALKRLEELTQIPKYQKKNVT